MDLDSVFKETVRVNRRLGVVIERSRTIAIIDYCIKQNTGLNANEILSVVMESILNDDDNALEGEA